MDGLRNYRKLSSIFLMISLVLFSPVAFSQTENTPRTVVLELESVEGATQYEVEVVGENENRKQKLKDSVWKSQLVPGQYQIRLRVYDDRGVPGEWSDSIPLTVQLEKVTTTNPKNGTRLATDSTSEESVLLQWKPVPFATEYLVKVFKQNHEVFLEKRTRETQIEVDLPIAQNYIWSVQALNQKGIPSETVDETLEFTVLGGQLDPPKLKAINLDEKQTALAIWDSSEGAETTKMIFAIKQKETWRNSRPWMTSKENQRILGKLPEETLYRLELISLSELRKDSISSVEYFEIRDKKVIRYGSKEPSEAERYLARRWLWSVSFGALGVNYKGENTFYGAGADFKETAGFAIWLKLLYENIISGVTAEGYTNYSQYSVAAANGDVTSQTWQTEGVFIINKLVSFSAFSLEPLLGGFYSEIPEFLGAPSTNAVALQYLRVMGMTLGLRFNAQISNSISMKLQLTLQKPFVELQMPEGAKLQETEPMRRFNFDLHYTSEFGDLSFGIYNELSRIKYEQSHFELEKGGFILSYGKPF